MQELLDKWDDLKKALSHKAAIQPAAISVPEEKGVDELHPDHVSKVLYGAPEVGGGTSSDNIGHVKHNGKEYAVRHGAAAHRTDVEHQLAKLLGADHMVPDQKYDHGINHPSHHNVGSSYHPHLHGGTSFQEYIKDPKSLYDALEDKDQTEKLKDQWKNGDLHKLWALHYISNNGDMHPGNFHVTPQGIKAFDSDHAFYELPSAHIVTGEKDPVHKDSHHLKYMPYAHANLPSYLSPFVENEGGEHDDAIEPTMKHEQVAVKQLNDHAEKIDPKLFEQFGPHVAERAMKAKKALASSDPTSEMLKLWKDHSDKTGDLKWKEAQKEQKKPAA